ncbi:hypothetical protein T440DRAFT_467942 [Plenodomus tracheiphilus IPT5]|uniref:Uncharacterized protein n=1 Tax=Plenodomus tracheiphilus IPT5 TaxID=1408161 RepID=A0A6A7B7J0_9PLEO|nr:hypothetical protein T440DRAFT_467942 [Plenodomus tracheiphilus IPT5]
MSSKRMFSWSKRQSSSEPYYRTGGLLPIDADGSTSGDALSVRKTTAEAGIQRLLQRPSSLKITSPISTHSALSPTSAQYDAAWSSAASNLQAAFNDMLHSPAPGDAGRARSASIQKPLPSRPRSVSLPTTPELPAELPGSILLENQGYPSEYTPLISWKVPQIPGTTSRDTCAADRYFSQECRLDRLSLIPEPLTHTKSVPNLNMRRSTMSNVHSRATLTSSDPTVPSPSSVQHERIRSETSARRYSRLDLQTPPSNRKKKPKQCAARIGTDAVDAVECPQPLPLSVASDVWNASTEERQDRRRDDLSPSVLPTPTTVPSTPTEDRNTSIPNQEHTKSTLQALFESLQASNEPYVASLVDAHIAEVTTLDTEAGVLEEQQNFHLHNQTSSNNLLFLVESTESPQTPTRDILHDTASTISSNSTPSFQSAQEKQQRSPQRLRNSPEMENLKRKLSSTRRPEPTSRNLLPELNQYKQNNVALQKQIESLMAKLNDSKKRERESRATCEKAEQECAGWQAKADEANGLEKSTKALQNTIDHLESRLEIANTARLDAEEQLCNMRADRSPFDTILTKLGIPITTSLRTNMATQNPHVSMSTVFSNASPSSPDDEAQELSTLSVFVTHIERLQDQVTQKDARMFELDREIEELRSKYAHLQVEHNEVTLRSDIQADLLQKSQQADTYIKRLRTSVFDREAVIGEKEKSLRAVERQLHLHKLLLQAEIRRHAKVKLARGVEDEALPALTTLAKQEDLDRWISNLNRRLQKNQPAGGTVGELSEHGAEIESLRREVDFYVREIIYYKLDIRGYKSDIRKLKRITSQLSSYGTRASDLDSESSSLRPVPTPSRSRFASVTPELGPSNTTSPIATGPMCMSPLSGRPITPKMANLELNSVPTPPDSASHSDRTERQRPGLKIYTTPQINPQNLVDSIVPPHTKDICNDSDTGALPPGPKGSVEERRKPTSSARGQNTFGELLAPLPLTTPDPPHQPDVPRNMSESLVELRATIGTPKRSSSVQHNKPSADEEKPTSNRERSASFSDAASSNVSPGRPSRPRLGLFRFSNASSKPSVTRPRTPQSDMTDAHMQRFPEADDIAGDNRLQRDLSTSKNEFKFPLLPGQGAMHDFVDPTMPPSPTTDPQVVPATSNVVNPHMETSPPLERKPSAVSIANIPFVSSMGSPHDPALITPTPEYRPTSCSITRNAPLKINPSIARTGVGGTMASSTPLTSPVSPTNASNGMPPPKPKMVPSVRSIFATPAAENLSNTAEQETGPRQRGPHTPSHSRTVSGSSIRTVIRMPKLRDKESKDTGIVRKDSISHPQPLASPFSLGRSMSVGSVGRHTGVGRSDGGAVYGIGEAI